jgi:predicted tellurium resistance membrane protein TerC
MDDLIRLAADPAAWAALATLITMEVVLGIDNLIFISILTNKLPAEQRRNARRIGIGAALVLRLALLATIAFIVTLTRPVFTAFGHGVSWRDLILIAGGLFLVWKATTEIHHNVDPDPADLFTAGDKVALGLRLPLVRSFCWTLSSLSTASSLRWA